MSHLTKIFDAWGGNAEALAADIAESGVVVRQWRNRGSVPSDHWPKIIVAAARRGFALSPEDFWPADVAEKVVAARGLLAESESLDRRTEAARNAA